MVERVYLDASVLTTLALRDVGFDRSSRIVAEAIKAPIVSDFSWGEFIAAVGARVRWRDILARVGQQVIADANDSMIASAPISFASVDVVAAIEMVADFDLALKLPDAIHIAIARRLDATLVRTDRQQVAAARRLGITCINPLEETS